MYKEWRAVFNPLWFNQMASLFGSNNHMKLGPSLNYSMFTADTEKVCHSKSKGIMKLEGKNKSWNVVVIIVIQQIV